MLVYTSVKFDILGFTETRLDNDLIKLYQLPGYNLFTKCRDRHGGGVAMYISTDHHSTISDDFCLLESFIECLAVECISDHRRYLSICVYRPPSGNVSDFLKAMSEILAAANENKFSSIYVFGDFNLDLLKYDNAHVFEFINIMFCYSLFPLSTRPTRITDTSASLTDHIWASSVELNISNYIIKTNKTERSPYITRALRNSIKEKHRLERLTL